MEVDTTNEFGLINGENLPNHSMSLRGRGKFIRAGYAVSVEFRTRQAALRFAAHLVSMAPLLPDEEGAEEHDFDTILEAIQGS